MVFFFFLALFRFILRVLLFCLHVCVYTMWEPRGNGGQKKAPDLLSWKLSSNLQLHLCGILPSPHNTHKNTQAHTHAHKPMHTCAHAHPEKQAHIRKHTFPLINKGNKNIYRCAPFPEMFTQGTTCLLAHWDIAHTPVPSRITLRLTVGALDPGAGGPTGTEERSRLHIEIVRLIICQYLYAF